MTTQPKTKAQRKSVAAKVAKDKQAGMTGAKLREKYGDWLTGPVRRHLFREFGHDGLIATSYDRTAARATREAQAKAVEAASAERKAKASSKRQPAKAQAAS